MKDIKIENRIVGEVICPDCGKNTAVKVNKNGSLYIYCTNIINDDTGERCYSRKIWGRAKSREFLKHNNIEVLHGNTGIEDIAKRNITDGNRQGNDGLATNLDLSIWN